MNMGGWRTAPGDTPTSLPPVGNIGHPGEGPTPGYTNPAGGTLTGPQQPGPLTAAPKGTYYKWKPKETISYMPVVAQFTGPRF